MTGAPALSWPPAYTYNAENRIVTANGVTYTYDGDGMRVKKSSGTLYWRTTGAVIAETNASGSTTNEYVLFSGRRIVRRDSSGAAYYYQADHLGSTRAGIQANGTLCYDADFTPYGQELAHTSTCPQNYRFTGYEWDSETGLDYAVNRYYNPRLGRFMTPDPAGLAAVDPANPQSWNRYAYVRNNPLIAVDPLGLDCVYDNEDGTVNIGSGDCNNNIYGGNGYYVDCDGCLFDMTCPQFSFT